MSDSKQKMLYDPKDEESIMDFIQKKSIKLRPDNLVVPDLMWKYLIRSAVRGKNIMMTGYSGCGKTLSAMSLAKSLGRPYFYFNLGATQDPRSELIGNTHFKKDEGTFFNQSEFIDAITTENAVILLDEFSRANPEAWNILMSALDYNQRYVRLAESKDRDIIHVAEGVTFIATANIGGEFTATRLMDRASLDRFIIVEVPLLDVEQEESLLVSLYPNLKPKIATALAEIAHATRVNIKSSDPKVNTIISTRMVVETAGLIIDGFSLKEAIEVGIMPVFDDEGEDDRGRGFVRAAAQRFKDIHNYIDDPEEPEEPEADDISDDFDEDEDLFEIDDNN